MAAARRIPLGLGAAAFAIAFLQRPGQATSDTKIDLHVDPASFLADVASLWSATGDLGHVQGGQYAGYLLPMGPFFALGDALGLSEWVIHRLWLGLVLALAAWGMVRMVDELYSRERGVAHLVAGAVILLNPYVVTFTNRTSVTLLAYAALPWLLYATARGVRTGRGWWWPVFFALVVALSGGGINAAVTAFVLIGPVLLLVYMWRVLRVPGRGVFGFAWRAAVAIIATSLWWLVPVSLHGAYGLDFLPFTESANAIWGSTSLSESLRLMGYWISYLGVGYGPEPVPYFTNVEPLLFVAPIVAATLLVPALALAGLRWTAQRTYAPFFLLLLLVGLVVMSLGFPEGTPLRRLVNGTYDEIDLIQFLRTTYKAGPLVAVSLAWLAGTAAAAAWPRLRGRVLRVAAIGAAAALLVLSSWPVATGRGIDELVAWDRIPAPWEDAAADLDDDLPPATRGVVLPGQLYAFYDWGATIDPVLPALTDRPVAVATVPPYSDLRAVDLLWSVDALVRQRRLVPGQLRPLLQLIGAGAVVTGTDDDENRSGAPEPAAAATELAEQGLASPARSYGDPQRFEPLPEDATPSALLPEVRRYDITDPRRIVRVEPIAGATVVDGSADGMATAAAFGRLPRAAPIMYAADRSEAELREAAADGASFVITDTNRKRVLVPSRPRQNLGATLGAADEFPENSTVLDPFPDAGDDAETLAVLDGARSVSAPFAPGYPQFPEHRPYAAVDGDPATYWLADSRVKRSRHRLEVKLDEPRDIPYIDIRPQRTGLTDVTAVEVNGRRFDVKPGGNRLPIHATTDSITVRIADVRRPEGYARGPGAIAELSIPGVRIRERLRPPTLVENALRAEGLPDVPLTYLFSRTSGDDPFRRSPELSAVWRGAAPEDTPVEYGLVARPGDGERQLARTIDPPSARRYGVRAWLALASDAPDPALDRLAGTAGRVRFSSSGRLHGLARHRASRAFDGNPATAWATNFDLGPRPWLQWEGGPDTMLRTLRLGKAPGLPLPTIVAVSTAGRFMGRLSVAADGTVRLPRPVNASGLRIIPAGVPLGATVVGIGEVRGVGVPRAPSERGGAVRAHCGDVWVNAGGRRLPLLPRGPLAALHDGQPLQATSCSGELALPAGRQNLSTGGALFAVEHLMLESTINDQRSTSNAGRVLDVGDAGRSSRDGVRVALDGPAWLVLGEAYNRGWRAWCDDRSLGEPEPIDGYANGWVAPADCRDVRFDFGPQRFVTAGYIGSGALLLLAVLLLILTRPRAPRWHVGTEFERLPSTRRYGPLPAALTALGIACVVAGLFGLRAGAVAAPILALLLWRGAGVPFLLAAASVLLAVVVPLLYILFPVENRNGFNPAYAVENIEAHWVVVAAWVLLAVALWRILSTASRRGAGAGRSGP